ncbi:MAG: serine/threonine protein kinase, partial [Candidatus Obscuribacterales bacterium]|nr:serine/threonine protein kinase [Candidatus Obscuribacterales bacterium]
MLLIAKKCPACNRQYNSDLVVCPKDRTMLLAVQRPEESTFQGWLYDSKYFNAFYCDDCKEYFRNFNMSTCPTDSKQLIKSPVEVRKGPLLESRFQLKSYIGKNSLFAVYLANDLNTNKPVAIKFLANSITTDNKTLSRILKIAQGAMKLRHPNIVSTHCVNVTEEGGLYFVEDYFLGASLEREIGKRLTIDIESVLDIFCGICLGLSHAHDCDIFHGALTSANIYLKTDREGKTIAMLGNFGIAERMFRHLEWSVPSTETKTSNVYGDPDSMCPEFAKGLRPNRQTDVYQLGCAIFEAVNGRPPFQREAPIKTMLAHLDEEPDEMLAT